MTDRGEGPFTNEDGGDFSAIVIAFLEQEGRPTYAEIVRGLAAQGERFALLQVRSFITKHGTKEVDQYCAQRLHDIRRTTGMASRAIAMSLERTAPARRDQERKG